MISREQTSNLVKLAILVMINLCIIYFAFSQSPSSTVVSAENRGDISPDLSPDTTVPKQPKQSKNFSKLTDFPLPELPMKKHWN